jgi:hypothetical protein
MSQTSEPAPIAGNSQEQRAAEVVMLAELTRALGVQISPRRLTSPEGSIVDVDGVANDGSVLVECWAHRGRAKGSQPDKLLKDAIKLHWVATWLEPKPSRLLISVSDPEAIYHLQGKSWQGAAMQSLGIELLVVNLPADVVAAIEAAQLRQFR